MMIKYYVLKIMKKIDGSWYSRDIVCHSIADVEKAIIENSAENKFQLQVIRD